MKSSRLENVDRSAKNLFIVQDHDKKKIENEDKVEDKRLDIVSGDSFYWLLGKK